MSGSQCFCCFVHLVVYALTACLMKKQQEKGAIDRSEDRSLLPDDGKDELMLFRYTSNRWGKDFLYQMSGRPFKSWKSDRVTSLDLGFDTLDSDDVISQSHV